VKAKDALIVWTPASRSGYAATRGKVRIGPLLKEGDTDWTRYPVEYASSGGAGLEVNKNHGEQLRRPHFPPRGIFNGCPRRD
jgi:hypothetical protein